MLQNQLQPTSVSRAAPCGVAASDKHCIVRIGTSWFSIPADAVREITIAGELVAVPHCHRVLAGLCHLRSEFVPVIALDALLDVDGLRDARESGKLVVIGGRNVWALGIAEAAAIESLETLVAPETRIDDGNSSPVLGTAMFRNQIVRVLDPNTVFRLAQQALENQWRRAPQPSCSAR
jgi:chemotaxis signal transduction protein